jgi:hypothetical protein
MQTIETTSDYNKYISEIIIIAGIYKNQSDKLSAFINNLIELYSDKRKAEGCLFDSKDEKYKINIEYKIKEIDEFVLSINNEIKDFKVNVSEYNNFTFGIDRGNKKRQLSDKIIVEGLFTQFQKDIRKLLKKFEENINFFKNEICEFKNISFDSFEDRIII